MMHFLPVPRPTVLAALLACLASGAVRAVEPRLSLNLQNADLRATLHALAQYGGRDMVIAETVKGQISLTIREEPWQRVLDILLQARGLEQRQIGNVLQIARREDWLNEDRQRAESALQRRKLHTPGLVPFPLRHRQAGDMRKLIEEGRLLSETGSVLVDTASNTLFIAESQEASLDKIRQLLALADRPMRQVQIEARIVEASDHFSRTLGNKLAFAMRKPVGMPASQARSTLQAMSGAEAGERGMQTPFAGAFGTLTALFAPEASTLIGLELRAMQASDQGKVISSPSLLTADRTEASIEEGSDLPYTQLNSRGTPSTAFKKAALGLRIKPVIAPDETSIQIEVEITKDSPQAGRSARGAPTVDTKRIRTLVQVENGGTVVLGGIFIEEQQHSAHGIPWLSDLPLVGGLFGTRHTVGNRRELLVFITPRIVS